MNFAERSILRFFAAFYVLQFFPFPLTIIPPIKPLGSFVQNTYQKIIPWFANNILKLDNEITVFTNGSGDTTYDWVLVLFLIIVSIIISILWPLLIKNTNYNFIKHWILVYLRYYLAYIMLSYGLIKVFQSQFPYVPLSRLIQTFGDASPMGLAWTFFGYSKGYNIFMGLAEVIGGMLLFHRRTTLLGSIFLVGVISNVVAVNFFYDIPVKLFSSQLLLIALIILSPHFGRIVQFLFGQDATYPLKESFQFKNERTQKAFKVLKWAVVIVFLYVSVNSALKTYTDYGALAEKPELYGLYELKEVIRAPESENLKDSVGWEYLIIEIKGFAQIRKTDKQQMWYKTKIDSSENTLILQPPQDSTQFQKFSYQETNNNFTLLNITDNDTLRYKFEILDYSDFTLTNRGFHWINEYPFNR